MNIEWNKVTWYSKLAALVIFGGTFLVAFYLGSEYRGSRTVVENIPALDSDQGATNKELLIKEIAKKPDYGDTECEYGRIANDSYMRKYVVEKGDTLLGISKRELGSVSRVNQIIEINKDFYPGLSLQSPFIEVDWILYLPPKFITDNSVSGIDAYRGKIGLETDDGLYIDFDTEVGSLQVFKSSTAKYLIREDFLQGDCVQVIVDADLNILALAPQGEDYFVILQWRKFVSPLYNYSIQYPLDWEAVSYGVEQGDIPTLGSGYHENHIRKVVDVQTGNGISIKVWDVTKTAMTQRFMENTLQGISWSNKITEIVLVDDLKALRVSGDLLKNTRAAIPAGESPSGETNVSVTFSKDDYVYLVGFKGVDLDNFNQILSTFRFTE